MTPTTNLSDRGGAVNLTRVFPKRNPKFDSNRTITKGKTRINRFNHNHCNYPSVLPVSLNILYNMYKRMAFLHYRDQPIARSSFRGARFEEFLKIG